jgi:hypothetical protein
MAYIPAKLREEVRKRANEHCEYCKRSEKLMGTEFDIDHIKPESKGGATESGNLALACDNCNGSKQSAEIGIDPDTNSSVPLFNPRIHIWTEHFRWSEDKTLILGISDVGRATVKRLKMNRLIYVHARAIWVKMGWPPA